MSMFVWLDMHVPCILDVHRIIEMSLLCRLGQHCLQQACHAIAMAVPKMGR
jgi:hypothetical protein